MTVTLPDALLAKLHPRRTIPGSFAPPKKNQLAALRKKLAGKFTYKKSIAKGVESKVSPDLGPLRRAAHALVEDLGAEALRAADLDVLAGFMCMVRGHDLRLPVIGALTEARPLADVVEAEFRALGFVLEAASGGWLNEAYLVRGDRLDRQWRNDAWLPLRAAVCAASDAEHAASRDRALRLREGAPPLDRAYLAFAFPDEPWADRDLSACLGDSTIPVHAYSILLSAARDPARVRDYVARAPSLLSNYALDLAVSLPEDDAIDIFSRALPGLLEKPKYGPLLKTPPRDVATALACFHTPAAAEKLAPYAGHAVLGAIVAGFFQSAPELASVLAEGAKTKAGRAVAERVIAQVTHEEAEGPEASMDEVPPVLRDRPWRPRTAKANPARVIEDLVLAAGLEEKLALPLGVRSLEETLARPLRDMTGDELAAHLAEREAGRFVPADYTYRTLGGPSAWEYVRVPDPVALEIWNAGRGYLSGGPLAFVARHGLSALPGFLANDRLSHLDYEGADEHVAAIQSFESPRIAPLFARIAARRKKHRRMAFAWLRGHPRLAALGLVPAAVGPHGAARAEAEAALLHLAEHGEADSVRDAASRYGDDARAVIDDLLAKDPLAIDQKPPKPPDFLRPSDLPAVRLRSGARLPEAARDALLEMLRVSSLDAPYAGLARVRDACDEASLARFAAALLEQWLLAGSPGRHDFMPNACVFFPSEETTRRLALLAREWARRDKAKATRACAALAAIGSDLALLHLGHIAETSRFVDLRGTVRAFLDEAADARGLTRDELEDRTVPDLGLDPNGTLTVSFGPRAFVATLDPTLQVIVKDGDGRVLRALPRKAKEDDAALAKAAIERLKALRADAAAIADRQIRRLERAMVLGRTFSARDFRERFALHPVVMHVARGLVWEALSADGTARTFRIAEDGTFADTEDDAFVLRDDDRVRIPHPLHLSAGAREAWLARFADYELVQPFEQLGRDTYVCTDADRTRTESTRVAGVVLDARRLLGLLEARGFERNDPGMVTAYRRTLPGAGAERPVTAELSFSPGIEIAYLDGTGPQTLGALTLADGGEPVAFGALDPVALSELTRDLEALRR